MVSPSDRQMAYDTTVIAVGRRVYVPVRFDADEVWGATPQHHVHGTMRGMGVRAVVEATGGGFGIVVGPAWRRDYSSPSSADST